MNDSIDTQVLEHFAFEGFLPFWLIVIIGVAAIGGAAWLAKRDYRFAAQSKLVFLLFGLRVIAIAVALWMLAGPTLVTTLRSFHKKAIQFFVDHSASMALVDPIDGSGNTIRWTSNQSPTIDANHQFNSGLGAFKTAQAYLTSYSRLPEDSSTIEVAKSQLVQSREAIDAGSKIIEKAFDNASTERPNQAIAQRIRQTLEDRVQGVVAGKAADLESGKTIEAINRDVWIEDCLVALASVIQDLERAETQLAESSEGAPSASEQRVFSTESTKSRVNKVYDWMSRAESSWLADVAEMATIDRYAFGEKVTPLHQDQWDREEDAEPIETSPNTNLTAPLRQVSSDSSSTALAASVVFTDGGHNFGEHPLDRSESLSNAPLLIVPIGNTKMQRDVILHHTQAPKAVFLNDAVSVESMLTAYDCEGEQLRIELLADGQVVDTELLTATSEIYDGQIQLHWKARELGRKNLALRVAPLSEERTDENNIEAFSVNVMEDTIRLLLADNLPRWEFRYLVNLFKRDERIQFEQLLFEPRHSYGRRDEPRPTLPFSIDDWLRYRVVILGDLRSAQLDRRHQELLIEYVTELGGNLIVIAGRESMPQAFVNQPLEGLLPVEEMDRALNRDLPHYLYVTAEGNMSMATQIVPDPVYSDRIWREMSQRLPLYNLSDFSKPKPTSHVLIGASQRRSSGTEATRTDPAFLSWHFVGRGRVVYIAAPMTYQLRYRQGDLFHHRFWGQLLRWTIARDLAEGSRTVRLSTDKTRYEKGDKVQAVVRLYQLDGRTVSGAENRITAYQDDRPVREIELFEEPGRPGVYRGMLEGLPEGKIKLRASGDRISNLLVTEGHTRPIETSINVDPSGALELRHPLCNMPLLRQLAEASGGMVIAPSGLESALEHLDLEPEVTEDIRRKPLWNRWDLLCLFVGCLTLEWIGRKYLGLV